MADTVQPTTEIGESCAVCLIEDAANYKGDPVADGTELLVDSAEACCAECADHDRCNSWVYCPSEDGCGDGEYYSTSRVLAQVDGGRSCRTVARARVGARPGRALDFGHREPHALRHI